MIKIDKVQSFDSNASVSLSKVRGEFYKRVNEAGNFSPFDKLHEGLENGKCIVRTGTPRTVRRRQDK